MRRELESGGLRDGESGFHSQRKLLKTARRIPPDALRTLMTVRSSLTVVLAAREGTRMRYSVPKVPHPVAGQSLLARVLDATPHGAGASLAVVVGPDHQ